MNMFNWKRSYNYVIIPAIVAILLLSFVSPTYKYVPQFLDVANAQSTTTTSLPTAAEYSSSPSLSLSLPDLYSKVRDSVVQVSDVVNSINGEGSRLGSGFIYDRSGHIVTNYHVVESNSRRSQFDVLFSDGSSYTAYLVGSDPYSDLAVLKVQNVPPSRLVPLSIANSSQLRVGDGVIAIGNPFGLAGSMTTGIVSGLSRILPSSDDESPVSSEPVSFSIPNIIQTDAAINPGNSGGPLLNANGKVIGINTAIFSDTGVYSGVGFAIPSDSITKIVPSLIRTGNYQHPYLGIIGIDVTPSLARQLGLKTTGGFLITSITSGGPADKYGLRAAELSRTDTGTRQITGGDIILKIDNQEVKHVDDVLSYLESHSSVGDTVHLTINRNGAIKQMDVVLDPRPSQENLQNIKAEQTNRDLGLQSNNEKDNDGMYKQCAKFAGPDLCGFFFGK